MVDNAESKKMEQILKEKFPDLWEKYGKYSPIQIVIEEGIENHFKIFFIMAKGYTYEEANGFLNNLKKVEKGVGQNDIKLKLNKIIHQAHGVKSKKCELIPEEILSQVWTKANGKCVKCGSDKNLEYDHIIPFSKGGSNTAENIQLLCEKCNRSKSNDIG